MYTTGNIPRRGSLQSSKCGPYDLFNGFWKALIGSVQHNEFVGWTHQQW